MKVSIKYFASLRELIGEADNVIEIEPDTTVSDLWQTIIHEKQVELDNVMMAVNAEYVKPDHTLNENDEVAFFPPVTGG